MACKSIGVKDIPNSSTKSKLKIACILDDFSMQCFSYECELILVKPDSWKSELTNKKPHFLFVESAWNGNEGHWKYRITNQNNQVNPELIHLVQWCRRHKIPTVFWNKEDPSGFNKFIESVKLFDYIFTTDEDMIENYRKIVGHDNIFTLPFAAQPKIHNPIRTGEERKNRLCFPGSFYTNKHEERRLDMTIMLEAASPFGLDIYDRFFEINKSKSSLYRFPEKLQPYILERSLKYSEVCKAYKNYKIILNVNSVKNSPTMFSRRVFEVLACGTSIVSNPSKGIEETFGKDLVFMGSSKDEYEKIINELMINEGLRSRTCVRGIREILNKHTYSHRLSYILERIGLIEKKQVSPIVTIMSLVKDHQQLQFAIDNFARQTYENKQLIIITFENIDEQYILKKASEQSLLDRLTLLSIKKIRNHGSLKDFFPGDYISYFDTCNYYSENYLIDLINARNYSYAQIIGKYSYFLFDDQISHLELKNSGFEYRYINMSGFKSMPFDACIIDSKLIRNINAKVFMENINGNFPTLPNINNTTLMLSIDKYNFIKGFYPSMEAKDLSDSISKYLSI